MCQGLKARWAFLKLGGEVEGEFRFMLPDARN